MNVLYDMETADPDDAMTLCFLLSHPAVNLIGITLTPGSLEQVGLVRKILRICSKDIPVGTRKKGYNRTNSCVSSFHKKWLGTINEEPATNTADRVIAERFSSFPDMVLLTGAALTNPYDALRLIRATLRLWVAQGGFAGDSVVPPEYRLPKFAGKEVCATFNFNGDPTASLWLLNADRITKRLLISKNVCHWLTYDKEMHEQVMPYKDKNAALNLLYNGMEVYLNNKPSGKLFHDPLAAATMVNPDICEFKEVELYRERGQWGSRLKDGTNTFISIRANREKFVKTLVE